MNLIKMLAIALLFAISDVDACQRYTAYADNRNGTITDPRTQLVWQKCYYGQTWNGSSCQGDVREIAWFQAMRWAKANRFLEKHDWRIPTRAEFETIIDPGCTWDGSGRIAPIVTTDLAQIKSIGGYSENRNWKSYFNVWSSDTTYENSDGKIDEFKMKFYSQPNYAYFFSEQGSYSTVFYPTSKMLNHYARLVRSPDKKASLLFEAKVKREAVVSAEVNYNKQTDSLDAAQRAGIRAAPQTGHGGIRDTYRFETTRDIQVTCNDAFKGTISPMDTGGWWYSGRRYEAEYAAAQAVCR
jgi:Protein of unknown function (DUF1566)